ncbi:MAG: hypothetical protein J5711_08615 [Bacteroidales bacterium]|nr:hypothetical protein [Bacteroidales bacterium]
MKIHRNGQVGRIVGYTVRGNDLWRSLASNHNDARSDAQLLQRARLAFVTVFIHSIGDIYKAGYHHYNTSKSQRANFFRQIYRNALSGNLIDGFTIDFSKVLVSRGNLTPAHSIAASVTPATQTATISWSDNSGVGDAKADDRLLYCIYNATKHTNVFSDNAATRAAETASATYPADWAGDTIYIYAAWTSSTAESDSKLLGLFTA